MLYTSSPAVMLKTFLALVSTEPFRLAPHSNAGFRMYAVPYVNTDPRSTRTPIMFTTEPALAISDVVICPEANATALDVEAIGRINANDDASDVGNMKYNGLIFSD